MATTHISKGLIRPDAGRSIGVPSNGLKVVCLSLGPPVMWEDALSRRFLKQGAQCVVWRREPRKLQSRPWRVNPGISVVAGDMSDIAHLTTQLEGCDAAYYLVHSMEASGKDYAQRDIQLASNFAAAAARAGVERSLLGRPR